jgi:hypothetical protein
MGPIRPAVDAGVSSAVRTYADHSCRAGAEGNMTPPNYVSNACGNDVDPYPDANQGGTPLCIAHDSRTHHLAIYRSWRVIVGGC